MQRKRKAQTKTAIFPIVLAAVISIAAFLGVACLFFGDLFFSDDKMIEVELPYYEGLYESEIESREYIELERSYVFSDNVQKGRVISQSKRGKIKIPDGERYLLRLDISLGGETYTLPELRGLDIYEASGIIREMGCVPKTVFSESDEPSDSVLFTLPKANSPLKAGETVTMYIATKSAPRTVRVPDFYGCSLETLQERVESAGLSVGEIKYIYSEDFLPNSVIYQSVSKNCLVKQGEVIDFYVSKPSRE